MIINLQGRGHLFTFGLGWTIWIAKPVVVSVGPPLGSLTLLGVGV